MQDIIRESLFGQAINALSKGRYFPYPEQKDDFQVPHHFLLPHHRASTSSTPPVIASEKNSKTLTPETTLSTRAPTPTPLRTIPSDSEQQTLNDAHAQDAIERNLHAAKQGLEEGKDPNLVGWYSDEDPENPQ